MNGNLNTWPPDTMSIISGFQARMAVIRHRKSLAVSDSVTASEIETVSPETHLGSGAADSF
jgi:aspartate carbamoyltransferase catalytic subunit